MQEAKDINKGLFPPMVEGEHDFASVTDKISDLTLKKRTPFGWFIGFGIAFIIMQLLLMIGPLIC